jgi:hypothetical protein
MDLQHYLHWLHLEPTHLQFLPKEHVLFGSIPVQKNHIRSVARLQQELQGLVGGIQRIHNVWWVGSKCTKLTKWRQ